MCSLRSYSAENLLLKLTDKFEKDVRVTYSFNSLSLMSGTSRLASIHVGYLCVVSE